MNEPIKAQWVTGLRSGDYKQTTGQLHGDDGFCCLGVLCDLHRKAQHGRWEKGHGQYRYLGHGGLLPPEVATWAGLRADDEYVSLPDAQQLTILNDGGATFEAIAALIEAQL